MKKILYSLILILAVACSKTIDQEYFIEVSTNDLTFSNNTLNKYITVKTNADIQASADKDWCIPMFFSSLEDKNLKIYVGPNPETKIRSAKVKLQAVGCDDIIINITQTVPDANLSSDCSLTSFNIKSSNLEIKFERDGDNLKAEHLDWIDKAEPNMMIPTFAMTGGKAYVNTQEVESGKTSISFAEDFELVIVADNGKSNTYNVSLNCPQINNEVAVLHIKPDSPINSKDTYVQAAIELYSPHTKEGWWSTSKGDGKIEIRGRGNSTWGLPKKPYRIKFPEKFSPLGLNHTSARSWVLLANDMDKSLIRNALAFDVSRELFNPEENHHSSSAILFTACMKFINVYKDNRYLGLYQLSDQMEERKGRINVEDLVAEDGSNPDKITGGYILESTIHGDNDFLTSTKRISWIIKYPDDEDRTKEQCDYIIDFVNKAEKALYQSDFKDPVNGWRKYFDENTLIDFIITKEICGDMDGFTSTYCYKRRGVDKLFFGPIWDIDKGWGNEKRTPHWNYSPSTSLMMFAGFGMPYYVNHDWFQRLWDDETFRSNVNNRWKDKKQAIMASILNNLNTLPAGMKKAIDANFQVWPFNYQACGDAPLPAQTYDLDNERMRKYTEDRAKLLDRLFAE